ncbi:hypothetical protein EWR22_27175 [Mycolicibacterium monacense DSM 44395]|nr:hypothetical protein EWR22_27175 [Mycolicibacterium monacense DSM 44395]
MVVAVLTFGVAPTAPAAVDDGPAAAGEGGAVPRPAAEPAGAEPEAAGSGGSAATPAADGDRDRGGSPATAHAAGSAVSGRARRPRADWGSQRKMYVPDPPDH